jgi:probable rRNA maturation factor
MNIIEISHEDDAMAVRSPQERVEHIIEGILASEGIGDVEISCSFVSDDTIRSLNRTYREKDEPTDVLSFVLEWTDSADGPPITWPTEAQSRILGDIVISLESVERNSLEFEVPFEEELDRVIVHGTLHLLGEDHATNDMTEPMLLHQESLLNALRHGGPN